MPDRVRSSREEGRLTAEEAAAVLRWLIGTPLNDMPLDYLADEPLLASARPKLAERAQNA